MVHASTGRALEHYAEQRDRLCTAPRCPAFFVSEHGTRITEWTLRYTFVNLSRQTGLREPAKSYGKGPRLLTCAMPLPSRHCCDGTMPVSMSSNMSRVSPPGSDMPMSATYWYLTATPELMQQAAQRLDRTGRGIPS